MSVPASKRGVSEFEFYNTAVRLRVHVTMWLLRDFGAKPRYRDAKFVADAYNMTDDDKKAFEELLRSTTSAIRFATRIRNGGYKNVEERLIRSVLIFSKASLVLSTSTQLRLKSTTKGDCSKHEQSQVFMHCSKKRSSFFPFCTKRAESMLTDTDTLFNSVMTKLHS